MYRSLSPIDNYTFKPGLKVKVINTSSACFGEKTILFWMHTKVGDIGTLTGMGRDPSTGEESGWCIRFNWYHSDHLFEWDLELLE